MEPLTAVGLAGNIVQFVDFALKVASGARDLYLSKTKQTWRQKMCDPRSKNSPIWRHHEKTCLVARPDAADLVPLSNDCNKIAE